MDRFETATTPAVARGYLLEAVRTLTPRWYIAGRTTRASTPVFTAGVRVRRTSGTADATIGYRLSPEIIVKAGYQGSRAYTALTGARSCDLRQVSMVFAQADSVSGR